MAEEESPLIKALPPESDYMTYLTIIEYNLSEENLPILHKVLQDETLTTNIGWDLVHLLVPYLPDSEQCLQVIARLGNPREVILKVTESLRLIEYDSEGDQDDEAHAAEPGASHDVRTRADSSTYPLKTAPTTDSETKAGSSQAVEIPPPLPLTVNQFIALLGMLTILHPRIKTKYPSRFLSTTLQAILASFSNSSAHREEMIISIVKVVKAVTGTKRPPLPSRHSSGMLTSGPALKTDAPAGDPEALASESSSPGESALQRKLLQSFITHVLEEYLENLNSGGEDVPGMAWCGRIMEKMNPERIIPDSKTFVDRFATEERLHRRIDAVGQLITLARDLNIKDEDLLEAALTQEEVPDILVQDEDDPPNSPEDIPLSRLGSLMMYMARQASTLLYDGPTISLTPSFTIFPDHRKILKNCLSAINNGTGTLGTEPESLIDAALALGILCLEGDAIGEPENDEEFNEYLQITAFLSSNCPSPNLRGHAHYITSTVLRSQPDENVRLAFIRDTLEHCPFENLKVSAVGWIKGETVEANPGYITEAHHHHAEMESEEDEEKSIFSTPLALDMLAPYLFPSLQADLITPPAQEASIAFRANLSFYLASLNFIYLLLCAKHLHQPLSIRDLWTNTDLPGSFLQPLRDASARFGKALAENGELEEESSPEALAELNVLNETLERVTRAAVSLNA